MKNSQYIYYSIKTYPTLENCLFGTVSLTKNADIDKYKCSGYDIGFDRNGGFSLGNGFGKNCIVLGADMSILQMLITKKIIFLSLVKILCKE